MGYGLQKEMEGIPDRTPSTPEEVLVWYVREIAKRGIVTGTRVRG